MTTIRAAVCRSHNAPLEIETLTLAPPGPGQVEVTIEAVAVCHSDISYWQGGWGGSLPAVYGHEAVGRIASLGAGVTGPEPGQRVLVTLLRACGACMPCQSGRSYQCEGNTAAPSPLRDAAGQPVTQALACAAFAERVVVDRSQIHPVPETIAPEAACLLSCGVITGMGAAINAAQVRPGQSVVVIGAGGVGLNAIQGARIAGAARIVAVDLAPARLDTARAFGATDTILATEPKPWAALRAICPRGADAVVICTGALPAFADAPRYLAQQGRMVMAGMPHSGEMASYEPCVIAYLGQALIGSRMGDTVLARDIPWMVDLAEQGRLKLGELVSGLWRLDQINEAIADTLAGQARRNVIVF